jgi:hypothetical protein
MHLFQGHRTSSEPLWHVGLPPLFTQAYIHSLHRFLAHFMICDDYFMISSGFPFQECSQLSGELPAFKECFEGGLLSEAVYSLLGGLMLTARLRKGKF